MKKNFEFSSRVAAHKFAREERRKGRKALVTRTRGMYTQPGRGLVSHISYGVTVWKEV